MTEDIRLSRSFQTAPVAVPGDDSEKYLRSGFTKRGFARPDWLVPDLEDGTAPSLKDEGLRNVVDCARTYGPDFDGEVWPRIEWSYGDERIQQRGSEQVATLVADAGEQVTGFVVPKVGRLDDVRAAESMIATAERERGYPGGTFEMSVIVETGRARSDLREIARWGADSRLHGLVFGPVDYIAELGGRKIGGERPTWTSVIGELSNEATANDLVAIGGPFDQIFYRRAGVEAYNADGYARNAEREARHGLDGSWSLHPKQTVQANHVHMPTEEELRNDVEYLETFLEAKEDGSGAILVDGQMVDEGHIKEFTNPLRTVIAVHRKQPDQTAALYGDDLVSRTVDLEEHLYEWS